MAQVKKRVRKISVKCGKTLFFQKLSSWLFFYQIVTIFLFWVRFLLFTFLNKFFFIFFYCFLRILFQIEALLIIFLSKKWQIKTVVLCLCLFSSYIITFFWPQIHFSIDILDNFSECSNTLLSIGWLFFY